MIKLKIIQNLSIKNKIVAIILLVTYLCLGLGFTFFTIWDMNRLKTEIQSNLTINAKLIGDNCIVPLTFNDKQQAAIALSRLRYIEFIEVACIHDKEGNLFASYPAKLNHDSLITHNHHYNNIRKDGYFYVQEPVIFKDELYGTIYLKANNQPLIDVKKNILLTLFLLSLVLFFLSYILAGRMQRFISLPIMKLKKHFDEIAENQDFSTQLTKINNDEVGSLYDGFNNLLNQIYIKQEERKRAEKNLNISENSYRSLFGNSPVSLWEEDWTEVIAMVEKIKSDGVTDFKTFFNSNLDFVKKALSKVKIIDVNTETLKMFKADDKSQLIESLSVVFATEDSLQGFIGELIALANKDFLYETEMLLCTVKGDYINAFLRMTFPSENSIPGQVLVSVMDFTAIKSVHEEIKNLNENLEKIVKERTNELKSKNLELEKMNQVFVGRELKMIELKNRIAKLEQQVNDN